MRLLFILILIVHIQSCFGQNIYKLDTILKGGYTLLYKVDDTAQHLYIKKDTIINEVANSEVGTNEKMLGFKVADFKDYFILGHRSGSPNNPNYIELIEKKTGNNLLPVIDISYIDANEKEEVFLYSIDVPSKGDSFTLYNVASGHKEEYIFPEDVFNAPNVLHRIKIKKVNKRILEIEYCEFGDITKTKRKIYKRE